MKPPWGGFIVPGNRLSSIQEFVYSWHFAAVRDVSSHHEPTIANNATQRQIAMANVMPNSTLWPEPDLAIAMARYYSKRSKTGTAGNYGARNLAFIAVFGPASRLVDQDALVARHARVVGAGRNGPNGGHGARQDGGRHADRERML
jgi:hypothetical protein